MGLSNEKIKPTYTSNKRLYPKLVWMNNSRIRLEFKASCLKQEDTTAYTPNNVVSLYTVYELDMWSEDLNANFTLQDCLFGNVRVTKNADPNKYLYSGCGVGFDFHSLISLPNDWGKSLEQIFFSSSMHANNKNKDIKIIAEAECSINFSRSQKNICLSLYYNGSNSFFCECHKTTSV